MEKDPNKKGLDKKTIVNIIAGAIGFAVGYIVVSLILK